MSNYVGEFEPGQQLPLSFNSRQLSGTPTSQIRKVGGGTAEFEILRDDGLVTDVTPILNFRPGYHKLLIDSGAASVSGFYQPFHNYSLMAKDVEVNNGTEWVSVTNEEVRSFAIINRTAGFVLDRSHKIWDGVVSAVTDARIFRVTGTGIDLTTDDYYVGKQLSFQPPSANAGIDLVVANSRPIGSEVEMTMQRAFPVSPAIGDPFDMIHHLPESVFTANIVFSAGSGAITDRATVSWTRDRELIIDVADKLPSMTMQVFHLTQQTSPTQRQISTLRETLTEDIDATDGAFHFAMAGSTQVGEGLHMVCSSLYIPSNRLVTDRRIMYVSP